MFCMLGTRKWQRTVALASHHTTHRTQFSAPCTTLILTPVPPHPIPNQLPTHSTHIRLTANPPKRDRLTN